MGRSIDRTRPFTEEEKEYLRSRGSAGMESIEINERQFGDLDDEAVLAERAQAEADAAQELAHFRAAMQEAAEIDDDSFHEDDEARVAPLSVRELRAALKKYNLPSEGDKDDLQFRLLEFLDAKRTGGTPVQDNLEEN